MRISHVLCLLVLSSPATATSLKALDEARDKIYDVGAAKAFMDVDANRWPDVPGGFHYTYSRCDDDTCVVGQAKLAVELPFAYEGSYEAQRNVAFCLTDGCDLVLPNPTLGCAWRVVILASGSAKVMQTDIMNLQVCLEQLNATEVATMKAQAVELYRTIYGREIAVEWR